MTIAVHSVIDRLGLFFEFWQEELLRVLPSFILLHRTLQNDSFSGDVILSRGDTVEKAHGFAGVDGNLASGSFQRMETFEG